MMIKISVSLVLISQLKDYFYPKTGNMTPNGSAERVPVFGYAKDVSSRLPEPIRGRWSRAPRIRPLRRNPS